jgi:cell fate (sporulation/competence/biofilm development) regulator YmcA (YheA/YmcA/DUF963 family)
MKTKKFSSKSDLEDFLSENEEEANWKILECYQKVLETEAEQVKPFSFAVDGHDYYVQMREELAEDGLQQLMKKAVNSEHYEVAQAAKELAERNDISLD